MAIVRVDYCSPLDEKARVTLAACINATMQSVLSVPPTENYVVCHASPPGAILHAPNSCPPERLAEIIFIQITLNQGRSPELKQGFFQALTTALAKTKLVKSENVYINLVEVARENWSFGIAPPESTA